MYEHYLNNPQNYGRYSIYQNVQIRCKEYHLKKLPITKEALKACSLKCLSLNYLLLNANYSSGNISWGNCEKQRQKFLHWLAVQF